MGEGDKTFLHFVFLYKGVIILAKQSIGYEHFVPFVKERPEYPGANTHILVRTIEELKSYLKDENKFMAVDTESTSLNPEEGFLVGYSFSFDGKTGYYVPVNHHNYGLGKESLDILVEFMRTRKMNFLYNVRFDFRYIEFAGYNLEGSYSYFGVFDSAK